MRLGVGDNLDGIYQSFQPGLADDPADLANTVNNPQAKARLLAMGYIRCPMPTLIQTWSA
jgi:hypothetical protein